MTFMLDTFPVVGIAVVAVALLAWRRRLREASVIAVGLILEILVFLSVTFVVARPRPAVPRLSSTPMTSSFPSGHTAAAVVLYGGIALAIHVGTRNGVVRFMAWVVAAAIVIGVGTGRVYRGMHHPTDVIVGACFGVACLWCAWLAVRGLWGTGDDIVRPEEELGDQGLRGREAVR
jgi:undecaprenyl-diphosphatase